MIGSEDDVYHEAQLNQLTLFDFTPVDAANVNNTPRKILNFFAPNSALVSR